MFLLTSEKKKTIDFFLRLVNVSLVLNELYSSCVSETFVKPNISVYMKLMKFLGNIRKNEDTCDD